MQPPNPYIQINSWPGLGFAPEAKGSFGGINLLESLYFQDVVRIFSERAYKRMTNFSLDMESMANRVNAGISGLPKRTIAS